jgi:hypothetical protein
MNSGGKRAPRRKHLKLQKPACRLRQGPFLFCFNLPAAAAKTERRRFEAACQACAPGHTEQHFPLTPSPPPPSFAIHRAPLPSPPSCDRSPDARLVFPLAQPHRAGASEPIHSNCVTMSPGAQRLCELPSSARALLGPGGGGASLRSPIPGQRSSPGRCPTLRPQAES